MTNAYEASTAVRTRYSLSDILNNPKNGRCIYRLDYKSSSKNGRVISDVNASSNQFNSNGGSFLPNENMLVEVEVLKSKFGGEEVKVLILREMNYFIDMLGTKTKVMHQMTSYKAL